MTAPWTTADIPPQHGRTVVVTGATSGIGLATARALTGAGAHVVLAVRDVATGTAVADGLPGPGTATVRGLDLADLASVRAFADAVDRPVDVLVNNAGLMAIPHRRTADGFEMQIGVNHLGHFALTGLLLDRITDRVVTLSSIMHGIGRVRAADPLGERARYDRWLAYGRSKLACLMFAYELEYRFVAAGSPLRSIAAHPGYAATRLQTRAGRVQAVAFGVLNRVFAQSPAAGALPTLYAATVPDLPGGMFVGPDGPAQAWGHPRPVGSSAASHDRDARHSLWARSAELTGVTYPI